MATGYKMRLKDGSEWILGPDGGVLYDGSRHIKFNSPHENWKIAGFSVRHNASRIITLSEAADGASLGQGWVHDFDHGSRRMWGSHSNHRVLSVEAIP